MTITNKQEDRQVQGLIEYVMRGRRQAILVSLMFSCVPFLAFLGYAVMGLVTLRKGAKDGGLIVLCLAIPPVIVMLTTHNPWIFVWNYLCGAVLVWLFAVLLRETRSWQRVFQLAVCVGVLGIIIFHMVNGNAHAWWISTLKQDIATVQNNLKMKLSSEQQASMFHGIARIATGMQAFTLLLGNLVALILARWWQSILYNVGGFKKEWHQLRVDKVTTVIAILLIAMAVVGPAVLLDCVPVMVIPFLMSGIGLVHFWCEGQHTIRLIAFYVLLVLFLPYVIGLLVAVMVIDSFFNLRKYRLREST